ncbi:dynamin family protein [Cellulomonas sp. S1-8]|uniref:dynamin family protein n=1 Tax=Cellulomonas sp. S1-8 TaxID=2904790 RepID=UPI002243C5D6|nr:dynamin family protein [Cellulomonas sp. S1-8]UZN02549.1 dynamin family protein [Cellulomonas sp. S1-8]
MGDVERLLDAVGDAAVRAQRDDLVQRVRVARVRLDDPAFRVVVCGEFKKGKSSLVNALLGARVCATDADVATAVPTYVRWGERVAARVLAEEQPDAAGLRDVAPADVPTASTGGAGATGRAVEIRLPRELLRGGLVLVDTPGISGGLASSHAGVALRSLAVADALLFVTDAGSELGAAEIELLRQAAALCPVVLVGLTRTDLFAHWRRIRDADVHHLRVAGVRADVFPLSAPLRHAGLRAQDRDLLAESGYPALAARLLDERVRAAGTGEAAAAAVAASTLGQLLTALTAEREGLADDATARERRTAWEQARARAADLRGAGARWQQVLFDRTSDLASEVESDLTVRLRALRRDAVAHIAELPATRLEADLGPWLQQRTTTALLDHQALVRTLADQVADAVAEQFGSAAWELRQGVATGGDGAGGVDVAFVAAPGTRASRLDLGLVALRGGSAGAMISHGAGLVLGLALPVVLPVAVVLSAVLAGRSWHAARAGQLRALRAETERAVGAYLEEVDTAARKQSRAAVRGLQRLLRETYAARAAELLATATTAVEQLSTAIAEDDTARMARTARVDAELDRLRDLAARTQGLLAPLLAARQATIPVPQGTT